MYSSCLVDMLCLCHQAGLYSITCPTRGKPEQHNACLSSAADASWLMLHQAVAASSNPRCVMLHSMALTCCHMCSISNHLRSLSKHLGSLCNHLCSLFNHLCSLSNHLCSLSNHLRHLQVEAEYGRLKITVQQASKKLVITASAPHRTFDLWTLPTTQGFQDKGIQTFSGSAAVEAFEHDQLIDSRVVDGVNLQFGAAYAARIVQRMTAQQYSSPLRVKGKGVTR